VSHHSTSDDSSAYRSKEEVSNWQERDSPISRFRHYLESKKLWSDKQEKEFKAKTRKEILAAFAKAEKLKKPAVVNLFTDVYKEMPPHLVKQEQELNRIRKKYPKFYDDTPFAK
jgi:2-oxoisovalerate dehydrogenase E1 component alpha subunit